MSAPEHGFKVGGRYRNGVGSYEVLSISYPNLEVRYASGQRATLTVSLQQRIQERLATASPPSPTTDLTPREGTAPRLAKLLADVSFWWVNQGSSYDHERSLGILAAPLHSAAGRALGHHEAMRDLRADDRVLHYVKKELLAIGRVTARTDIGASRPDLLAGRRDHVYIGHVAYTTIGRAIHIDEIPVAWRIAEGGVFDKNGNPKFGYLYPLSRRFVQRLANQFGDRLDHLA